MSSIDAFARPRIRRGKRTQNCRMTQLADLSHEELFSRAQALRSHARDDATAAMKAEALAAEARRRFGAATTLAAPLVDRLPASRGPWWRFW
jgi:hypothetical protein